MENNIKSWKVTYKRGDQIVKAIVYAATKSEASRKARANGIIKENGRAVDFWEVESVEELNNDDKNV